jgi:hypothetical protein
LLVALIGLTLPPVITRGRVKSGQKFDDVVVVNESNAVKVSRAKCSTFTIEHINPVIENIDSTGTLDVD